ncbi:MAG: 5-guanidino-2-oxopentanoate decarboxylase [Gammaproteobacteria bacterium]|nr:5-guanidino-2-oxopentanoate decarboxylase [Gammaproteobacteria bacterium]
MPTCGQTVARHLETHGVTHVFGVPGNHTLELYRGLESSTIRHVTTRHEQGAAFMADGFARASGRPGVCFLISGPGLLNAATAIAQARADSIPMLVVTTVAATTDLGRLQGKLHELPDQHTCAANFCKASVTITDPNAIGRVIGQAFHAFTSGRPGPVHIEIPLDLLLADTTWQDLDPPVVASTLDDQTLEDMASLLQRAKRPLCIVGGGAVGAGKRIPALAEHFDMPIVNTVNAKGLCPRGHPLFVGGSPSLASVRELVNQADVVLAIGSEFGETDYDLLMIEAFAISGKLLRIDIDPDQLDRNVESHVTLCADARLAVGGLLEFPGRKHGDGARRAERARQHILEEPHYHAEIAELFATIRGAAPDIVLVGDSTRPTYYAAWQYECEQPRSYFHSVSGFGTLGYAIPAAFGARLATGRPVAALIGDGGAQFTLSELATAVDNEVGVPIIIWLNRGFEEIENSLTGRGISAASAHISGPDFSQIAEAYGCAWQQPSDLNEFGAALAAALERNRPTLILLEQARFLSLPSGQWYGAF